MYHVQPSFYSTLSSEISVFCLQRQFIQKYQVVIYLHDWFNSTHVIQKQLKSV